VADYYRKNKYYLGAVWRLEYIQENYPNFSQIDLVNEQIGDLKTLLEEREAAWKKQLEELKKESED
jgi:outer membrane protein assembly factor BamD (BamD/ComL family)